tara:strand:+ start:38 stop:301 length:264 start_codon:yes stop_codon:yes gene_type:complete
MLLPDGYIKRITSTIPFGYEVSDIVGFLKPIPNQLEALDVAEAMVNNKEVTLRDASFWLHNETGRYISHVGLKNYIDKRNKYERETE